MSSTLRLSSGVSVLLRGGASAAVWHAEDAKRSKDAQTHMTHKIHMMHTWWCPRPTTADAACTRERPPATTPTHPPNVCVTDVNKFYYKKNGGGGRAIPERLVYNLDHPLCRTPFRAGCKRKGCIGMASVTRIGIGIAYHWSSRQMPSRGWTGPSFFTHGAS